MRGGGSLGGGGGLLLEWIWSRGEGDGCFCHGSMIFGDGLWVWSVFRGRVRVGLVADSVRGVTRVRVRGGVECESGV